MKEDPGFWGIVPTRRQDGGATTLSQFLFYYCAETQWLRRHTKKACLGTYSPRGLESMMAEQRRNNWELTSWSTSRGQREHSVNGQRLLKLQSPPGDTPPATRPQLFLPRWFPNENKHWNLWADGTILIQTIANTFVFPQPKSVAGVGGTWKHRKLTKC